VPGRLEIGGGQVLAELRVGVEERDGLGAGQGVFFPGTRRRVVRNLTSEGNRPDRLAIAGD
jgi:hypothetical protein